MSHDVVTVPDREGSLSRNVTLGGGDRLKYTHGFARLEITVFITGSATVPRGRNQADTERPWVDTVWRIAYIMEAACFISL